MRWHRMCLSWWWYCRSAIDTDLCGHRHTWGMLEDLGPRLRRLVLNGRHSGCSSYSPQLCTAAVSCATGLESLAIDGCIDHQLYCTTYEMGEVTGVPWPGRSQVSLELSCSLSGCRFYGYHFGCHCCCELAVYVMSCCICGL